MILSVCHPSRSPRVKVNFLAILTILERMRMQKAISPRIEALCLSLSHVACPSPKPNTQTNIMPPVLYITVLAPNNLRVPQCVTHIRVTPQLFSNRVYL